MKTKYYQKVSNLNFMANRNKNIGIEYFKWIVKNSFFKFFNQKIKVDNRNTDLTEIRKEMTMAEISHLIAFALVTVIALYISFSNSFLFGLTILIVNILMNLYPSLLQQDNKRRIDKVIKKQRKTVANNL